MRALVKLRGQIEATRGAIRAEETRIADVYENEYRIAKARESELASQRLRSWPRTPEVGSQVQVTMRELESSAETLRTSLQQLPAEVQRGEHGSDREHAGAECPHHHAGGSAVVTKAPRSLWRFRPEASCSVSVSAWPSSWDASGWPMCSERRRCSSRSATRNASFCRRSRQIRLCSRSTSSSSLIRVSPRRFVTSKP